MMRKGKQSYQLASKKFGNLISFNFKDLHDAEEEEEKEPSDDDTSDKKNLALGGNDAAFSMKTVTSGSPIPRKRNISEGETMQTNLKTKDRHNTLNDLTSFEIGHTDKKHSPEATRRHSDVPVVEGSDSASASLLEKNIRSTIPNNHSVIKPDTPLKKEDKTDTDASTPPRGSLSLLSFSHTTGSEVIKGLQNMGIVRLKAVKRALESTVKENDESSEKTENVTVQQNASKFKSKPADLPAANPPSTSTSLSTLLAVSDGLDNPSTVQRLKGDSKDRSDSFSKFNIQAVQSTSSDILKTVDKKTVPCSTNEASLSIHAVYILSILPFLLFTLPLPAFIHYIVLSFFIGAICAVFFLCLVVTPKRNISVIKPPYTVQQTPLEIPKYVFDPNQAYRGWMNEIDVYDMETYHVSSTSSVFVTLEGRTLRLQTPRRNIPRRASHNERNVQVSDVITQRLYDLSDAKVYLLPSDLVKKRVWSKKYPICIEVSSVRHKSSNVSVKLGGRHDSPSKTEEQDTLDKVYLFGRTQPQKEQWFYRFQRSIALAKKDVKESSDDVKEEKRKSETYAGKSISLYSHVDSYKDYFMHMCRLLPDPALYMQEVTSSRIMKSISDHSEPDVMQFSTLASHSDDISTVVTSQPLPISGVISNPEQPCLEVAWFNVVVGRAMFDFLRLSKWADWVSSKLQKKLEKIRLPYFMEGLKLNEIDLGKTVPLVHKISLPRLDAAGIWMDMDITYEGAVQMTLETKMVLTRLGKQQDLNMRMMKKTAAANSDEEDSAESSEDEESILKSSLPAYVQNFVPSGTENTLPDPKTKGSPKPASPRQSGPHGPVQEKKWVRIVDTITKSKYFQRVAETNYVKKKLETVSNTPLILAAELVQCRGTLCVNIPPPPSDRVWYGFKEPPDMVINARPKLGERAVTVAPITDWIEKKLLQEFNKIFVMPNMDDIPVPIMFNNLSNQSS